MIVCLCVFGYSAFNLYKIFYGQHQVKKETEELQEHVVSQDEYLEPDWESLKAESPEIIGWIYIPDCNINFPVVQGSDNSYYLTHTTKGEYNNQGAIFLDKAADSSFTNDNSIIYGHSVEGGGMFTDIKNYSDQDFFNNHTSFYLLTPNGNYECQVLTYAKSNDTSVYYTTSFGDYREDVINQMVSEALYANNIDVTDRKFVTISTCDLDYGFDSDRRLILTAALNYTQEPVKIVD